MIALHEFQSHKTSWKVIFETEDKYFGMFSLEKNFLNTKFNFQNAPTVEVMTNKPNNSIITRNISVVLMVYYKELF
jgi:hypothetical protein